MTLLPGASGTSATSTPGWSSGPTRPLLDGCSLLHAARYYWLFGTAIIVPLALIASRLLGADPFSKGNPLGEVVGQTHASIMAMTFPLVLIACFQFPHFMILIMAISFSLDFYLMSWAFGSRLFAIHAFARTGAVTAIWLLLPNQRAWLIPIVVALAYGMTVAIGPTLRRRWLAVQADRNLVNST